MKRQELMTKYEAYHRQGHLVPAVTLSTFIKSATYAHSDRTRQLWDHHFIRRVERRLPERARDKNKIDHDYVMEESPESFWHYHGLLAVPVIFASRFWINNALHPRLYGDIYSFRRVGTQRSFKVNEFLIEPVHSVSAWCGYITKQQRRYALNT